MWPHTLGAHPAQGVCSHSLNIYLFCEFTAVPAHTAFSNAACAALSQGLSVAEQNAQVFATLGLYGMTADETKWEGWRKGYTAELLSLSPRICRDRAFQRRWDTSSWREGAQQGCRRGWFDSCSLKNYTAGTKSKKNALQCEDSLDFTMYISTMCLQ